MVEYVNIDITTDKKWHLQLCRKC